MFYCLTPQISQDFQSNIPKIFNFGAVFPCIILLNHIFVRLRIDDKRQPIAGCRFYLSGRHLLLPDTEKRM